MDTDPGEEFIKDLLLNDKRELHWRMVFEKKNGRVDGNKVLLHAKRWGVYN